MKAILAFSGGLDTTFCIPYLMEQGYDVITVTVDTGGFSKEKLDEIETKAKQLGAVKHYTIDAQKDIYEQIIKYIIKFNALYQGEYPLMCADRYVIAQKLIEIAKIEKTNIVAHGSTSIGNDQVRFDSALLSLKPDIKIICPIKALNITRDEEIEYLKEKGIEVPSSSKKYSINENVFGITVSGSEIDKNLEPSKEAYTLTKQKNIGQEYITIEFDQGLPIKLNSQPKDGLEILKELNKLIGAYGFGAKIYTGDCIIGIKGHIMFEAPGLLALIKAHQKLEQITLTKKQLAFNSLASQTWSDLVYSALYYEPLTKDLEEYADSVQEKVTGKVKIKLIPNNIEIVELQSNNSLIKDKIATYAQKANWNAEQADGFIKLYTLQEVIANAASK